MIHLVLAAAMASSPSQARYNGPPDLALTAAVVQAGGGPKSFSSQQLFSYLAGKDAAQRRGRLNQSVRRAKCEAVFCDVRRLC